MVLAKRVSGLKPSSTLAIEAKAKEMRKRGMDVISFGAGEPDFNTPTNIKEEAIKAVEENFTRYTSASGIEELKEAIGEKLKRDNGLSYERSEIIISNGAKHSLFNALFAICDPGDEVIIPSPYWVSYPEMVKLIGATPVFLETSEVNDYKLDREMLKRKITKGTKAIIINSPSNPTGAMLSPEDLKEIAEIALERGIYLISDEIYEKIVYDGAQHTSIASLGEEVKNLTLVINGVSKTYAMTGWRIGYAAGPKEVIKAMSDIQSHTTSNPNSIAQRASLAALKGQQRTVAEMVAEFDRRRRYMVERLSNISGITCSLPRGAFYVFPNISALLGKRYKDKPLLGSQDLATFLLSETQVAVVPGIDFGSDRHLRLSYATSFENIVEGLNRMEKVLGQLS